MNRVILVGNLTRDAEIRRTQSGMTVMTIGLAVNNRRKNSQTGQWEDEPMFIDCVMFGTRAEAVSPYLQKGSKVGIDGKLRFSTWEREGQKRSKHEVMVDDIELLTPKQQGNQAAYNGQNQSQPNNYSQQQGYALQTGPQQTKKAGRTNPQQQWSDQQYQQAQMMAPQEPATSVYDDDIPF